MGKDECKSVVDVEEGEISDSASVEEISEEDFIKQEAKVTNTTNSNSKPRVWTMGDLYKYSNSHSHSHSRNYVSGLYNLAWAQAVQNKPLNDVLVMEFKSSENSNSNLRRSSSSTSLNGREDSKNNSSSSISSSKEVNNKVIIDVSGDDTDDAKMEDVEDEKEEGELEEGEIDLVSEMEMEDGVEEGKLIADDSIVSQADADLKEELEKRVNSIREELKTVTVNGAENSYDAVCSRLQNLLGRVREVFLQNSVPTKDDLVQLSFVAIQTLHSVFLSMNQTQKEQNREILSRLLGQVTRENTPFFSPEQMKEVEVMIPAVGSCAVVSSTADSDMEKKIQVVEKLNQNDSDASGENAGCDLTSSKKFVLDSRSIESLYPNDPSVFPEPLKLGPGSSKGRGVLLPLLDLHKDHDADSLPSPTRETPPRLLVNRVSAVGETVFNPDSLHPRVALDTENTVMHPYETDALKAVSTYQQKFGRSSFILRDRLPSPTPSEEYDDGDGGSSGEVSSSSIVVDANSAYAPNLARPSVSSAHNMDISSVQGLSSAGNAGILSSGSNSALRALARSRDPRLRYAKSSVGALDLNQFPLLGVNTEPKVVNPLGGTIISKKQKIVEEPVLDGPEPKRQRTGLTDSGLARDVPTSSGSGGWLEDRGTVRPLFINRNQGIEKMGSVTRKLGDEVTCSDATSSTPNVTTGGNEQLPVTVTSTTASLHSILKDIAVNPSMLMNIIKMEQQKSVDPAKSAAQSLSSNSILGAVPLMNVAPSKPSELGQRSAGLLQTPQTASTNMQNELGKVRMKPRDPRRVLHNNPFLKPGSLGSDQFKTNVAPIASSQGMKGNLYPQKQEDESDKNSVPSQSIAPPDIALQFTKNLKNIADIISVSLAPMSPAISLNFPLQPVQVPPIRVDVKGVVPELGNLERTSSSTEEVAVDPSGSKNTWGEVEHLFEGFDDHQKAAIQKERARRIAEQKKMFAARKLCLVLDLDHTLLNSAKFVEVDSVHDEILRKKEEQDREKPQRHLFRFPYMGMWTKLRPGIWNFLEKASKLFELHLYTMGNKLYATEMAKLLDPKGVLFAGRVISRGDDGDLIDGDERVPKSKDLEGVLGMESSVVIIDDSVKVWPHNKLNLIVVERYIYFPCSRRQFGLPGPSLLEIDHDERSEDGTLASSLAVIERIHENFFSHRSLDEADVRNILSSEQRQILGGCRIVFSRVFPVGEANPHLHPLWQTAEQFGAVCVNQIDEQVTHVVANSLGTDKVNWALSTGRFVVHPGWVEASALLYRRANELDFAIKL